MSEITVGVRDLGARLGQYLRKVKQGQMIIITERGQPIAQIAPTGRTVEERILPLHEAGLVAWNGQKLEPTVPAVVNRSDRQVSDILVAMRD